MHYGRCVFKMSRYISALSLERDRSSIAVSVSSISLFFRDICLSNKTEKEPLEKENVSLSKARETGTYRVTCVYASSLITRSVYAVSLDQCVSKNTT